jgi:hypothetical protein
MVPETDPLDTCASAVCWLTNDRIKIMATSSDAKQKQDLPEQFLLRFLEIDATLRFIPTPLFMLLIDSLNTDGVTPVVGQAMPAGLLRIDVRLLFRGVVTE